MEYVSGERLDNLKYMEQNNIDPSEVSSCLSHIFNNMILPLVLPCIVILMVVI